MSKALNRLSAAQVKNATHILMAAPACFAMAEIFF
jgi:hypothetical protein